jgi:DNA polymerase-3 subunit beta
MERKLIFISDNSKSVRFYFHQDLLEISLTNNELGSSQDQFDIDYQGPSFEVGYNCQYIADFLKTVPYEFVDLHVKDAGNQAIWTVGQDDLPYDYKHVIMPLRIHD